MNKKPKTIIIAPNPSLSPVGKGSVAIC